MKSIKKTSVDPKAEDKKKKRKLAVHIFCAAVTLIVLIISIITFGWFTQNNSAAMNSTDLSAASGGFELAAVGENGIYDKYLNAADGKSISGIIDENSSPISPVATEGGNEIKWMMSDTSNINNNSGSEYKDIEPGSSGILSFYVIPKNDQDLNVKFTLDAVLYKGDLTEVTSSSDNSQHIINAENSANKLFSGHILFFKNYDVSNKTYSERIDNTFTFERADAKANTAYRVDIYWIWPNVIDQLVLPANDNKLLSNGFQRIISDEDITFLTDFVENSDKYFYSEITDLQTRLDSIKVGSENGNFSEENYNYLNEEWNKADQIIGTSVSYVELKLSAE